MGIDVQTREPVQRPPTAPPQQPPIDLFFDPAYETPRGANSDALKDPLVSRHSIPAEVAANLSPGQRSPSIGTPVAILCLEASTVTAWAPEPAPHRIGQILGPAAEDIARTCRATVGGLTGVVAEPSLDDGGHLRVQIHGA